MYTVFEMKGEGCSFFQSHLSAFIRALAAWGRRWSGKRVDFRWDGSSITPAVFDSAVRAGSFVSRSLTVADRKWYDSFEGSTAYLGDRKKAKLVRVYDRRGFNRVELELGDDNAHSFMLELVAAADDRWPAVALNYLVSTVDFRDVGGASRVYRSKQLPWWAEFVGQAQKVKSLLRSADKITFKPLPIGLADEYLKRHRRSLRKFEKAFGMKWIAARVRAHSLSAGEISFDGEIVSDSERLEIEVLRSYAGSGLCGLDSEDLPF
jgi:hypothetical protein